jgi:hypothetical protein
MRAFTGLSVLSLCCILAVGCVTKPTRQDTSAIQEPATISFKFHQPLPATPIAIYIDGLAQGDAQDFQTDNARLQLVTGTHLLELKQHGETIKRQKIFVSRGSNKEILVAGPFVSP